MVKNNWKFKNRPKYSRQDFYFISHFVKKVYISIDIIRVLTIFILLPSNIFLVINIIKIVKHFKNNQ